MSAMITSSTVKKNKYASCKSVPGARFKSNTNEKSKHERCLLFCGGEGGISLRACCNINSNCVRINRTCFHCVTATPLCSLHRPPDAVAHVPILPVPGARFKSNINKKTSTVLCLLFCGGEGGI